MSSIKKMYADRSDYVHVFFWALIISLVFLINGLKLLGGRVIIEPASIILILMPQTIASLYVYAHKKWDSLNQAVYRGFKSIESKLKSVNPVYIYVAVLSIISAYLLASINYKVIDVFIHEQFLGNRDLIDFQGVINNLSNLLPILIGLIASSIVFYFIIYGGFKYKRTTPVTKGTKIGLALLIFFILTRLFFIFYYQGNYQDDWPHLVAGLDIFKTGRLREANQYFEDYGYLRGLYVTYWAAFVQFLFGKSVNIAQFAPASIGLINFLLFTRLLKKYVKGKFIYVALVLSYILNPYTIFSHIYIRMYVFYELFFLLNLSAVLSVAKVYSKDKWKGSKFALGALLILLFNLVIYGLSRDRGSVVLHLYPMIGVGLIVSYDFLTSKGLAFVNRILKSSLKVVLTGGTLSLLFILASVVSDRVLMPTNLSSARSLFLSVLLGQFGLIMIFPLLLITQLRKLPKDIFIIAITTFSALIIHLITPTSYQILRGFIYMFAPLYLTTGIALGISLRKNQLSQYRHLIVGAILILSAVFYPPGYLNYGPSIIGEVGYYEFTEAYDYIEENTKDKIVVQTDTTVLPAIYFEQEPDYVLNLDSHLDGLYYPPESTVINSIDEFNLIAQEEDVCFVTRTNAYERLLNEEFVTLLESEYLHKESLASYDLWCEKSSL